MRGNKWQKNKSHGKLYKQNKKIIISEGILVQPGCLATPAIYEEMGGGNPTPKIIKKGKKRIKDGGEQELV